MNELIQFNRLKDLYAQLNYHSHIYCTEKDTIKANNANWEITKILEEIRKIKS